MSPTTNPNPDLMRIFDFTAADLEANRAGKMSDGQKQQLLHIAQSQKDDAGCLIWLMTPGYIFLACIALQAFGSGNKTYALIFVGVITALLFGQAAMLYDSHYRNHLETDVVVSEFEQVQGLLQPIIKKSWYRARQIENEYLRIGQMDIPIKKSVYKALQGFLATQSEVPTCRIYYVPKSLQIIAAEIVE